MKRTVVDMDLIQLEKLINILKSIQEPESDVDKRAENRVSSAKPSPKSPELKKERVLAS